MGKSSINRLQCTLHLLLYLLSLPLLGDYLEDGLAMFDEGIVDDSDIREGVDSENEPVGNTPDKPQRQ